MKQYQLSFDKPLIILENMVKNKFSFFRKYTKIILIGLSEPGIFRRTALISLIKQIQEKYNEG